MIAGLTYSAIQRSGSGGSPPVSPDTTPAGEQIYLVIGESNAGDTSAALTLGVTTPPDVCAKWNFATSQFDYLTTLDMNNAGAIYGTGYKRFALNRFNRTGLKSLFINCAASGSEFIPNGDNNNWSTTGTRYAAAKAAAIAALANKELQKLKGIRLFLGSNDIRTPGLSLADIYAGMVSLIERLRTDFPEVPIYMTITNMYDGASATMDARKWGMMKNFFDLVTSYDNVEIINSMLNMWVWGYGFGDSLHLTTPGYELSEAQFERAVSSSETDREIRRLQTMLENEPTTTQKSAIATFYNNGWFGFIDSLQIYGKSRNRTLYDWTGRTTPLDSAFDVVNDNYIHTDATPKYLRTNYFANITQRYTTVSDFIEGTRTGVNLTAAGVSGIPMGTSSASRRRVFQTTSSNIFWNCNDSTNTTYTGWTKIPDNTKIAIGRNGTQKQLYGNSAVLQTATVAVGAIDSRDSYIGGNGSAGFYIDCQFDRYYYIKNVGVNLANFDSDLDVLIAAMAA